MKKTKIICTVGPASEDYEMMKKLILNGMNVMRLNFSHGDFEEHGKRIINLNKLRKELNVPVAIMLDTKGPEIRIKKFKDDKVELVENQEFTLVTEDIEGDSTKVAVTYTNLYKDVTSGTRILVDDGLIELIVKEIKGTDILCTVKNGGILGSKKSVNVPDLDISLPALTEKDIADIKFGVESGIDFIAASFIRKASDVIEIRKVLEKFNASKIKIISKIECRSAVKNIDEIIKVSDGIMVARGDLGVEIPTEEVPIAQKMIIKKCNQKGVTVVTATQMLDSMIRNPRPTRAEATDVANAIYDGTDAIMLSGETANGNYPIEAVSMMARIAERTEASIDYRKRLRNDLENQVSSVTNAISHATVTTATDIDAAAILTITQTGFTARMVAKHRPHCPVIAMTFDERTARQLNLVNGVIPLLLEDDQKSNDIVEAAKAKALESKMLTDGDVVVITAGVPIGASGATNLMKVEIMGKVLLKGIPVGTKNVSGNVYVVRDKDVVKAEQEFKEGDIIAIESTTSKEVLHLLKKASAIITEETGASSPAAVVGQTLDVPVITGAAGATIVLKTGTQISIDMKKGLVYSGL